MLTTPGKVKDVKRRGLPKIRAAAAVPSLQKQVTPRPGIAVCLPLEESVYAKWVTDALIPMMGDLSERDFVVTTEGAFIDTARRTLAEQALESEAEYLFWMDSDNVPPKGDVIGRLLSHGKDIVGGWYHTKKHKHPCVYDLVDFDVDKGWRNYRPRANAPDDGRAPRCLCGKQHAQWLEKVDGLGFGCLLIHRRVFEAFQGARWFSTQFGTEDLWFEHEAKQLGFDTFVDWGIHAAHLGVFGV